MRRSIAYGGIGFHFDHCLQSTERYTSMTVSEVIHTKHAVRQFTDDPCPGKRSARSSILASGRKAKSLSNLVKAYVRRFSCIKHLFVSRLVVSGPGSRRGCVLRHLSNPSSPIPEH